MQKPQKFKTRVVTHHAMQFTGKNGRDIAAWINETEVLIKQRARNGGKYVSIVDEDSKSIVLTGDFVVLYPEGFFGVVSSDIFAQGHVVTSKHNVTI